MSMQDRLRDRVQFCALTNDLIAPGHLSAQAKRVFIRNPDLRQEATRVQPGQHTRIDCVRLGPRLSDQPDLARIGDY